MASDKLVIEQLADVPSEMKPHLVPAETVTPGVAWLEIDSTACRAYAHRPAQMAA